MHSPLEDFEFLARSENRVAVLNALNEESKTRDELKQVTGASRTTLSRMLADFEERNWVVHLNGRFRSTSEGAFVASEVTRLLENMATAKKLNGALQWLPINEFEFDLSRLRDAETVAVRWDDPASMRKFAEHFDGATRVRSTATTVSRDVVDLLWALTVEQGGAYEGVLIPETIERIREHPTLCKQLREMLASGRASLFRYKSDKQLEMVMFVDDFASICNHGDGGMYMDTVVSDDDAFRSWVERYVDSAIADSTPLDADAFAP